MLLLSILLLLHEGCFSCCVRCSDFVIAVLIVFCCYVFGWCCCRLYCWCLLSGLTFKIVFFLLCRTRILVLVAVDFACVLLHNPKGTHAFFKNGFGLGEIPPDTLLVGASTQGPRGNKKSITDWKHGILNPTLFSWPWFCFLLFVISHVVFANFGKIANSASANTWQQNLYVYMYTFRICFTYVCVFHVYV